MKPIDIILGLILIVLIAIIWTQLEKLWLEILLTVWLVIIAWIYIGCVTAKEMPDNFK